LAKKKLFVFFSVGFVCGQNQMCYLRVGFSVCRTTAVRLKTTAYFTKISLVSNFRPNISLSTEGMKNL